MISSSSSSAGRFPFLASILLLIVSCGDAFQVPVQQRSMATASTTTTSLSSPPTTTTLFLAKKRQNRSSTTGKGFSTEPPAATPTTKSSRQVKETIERRAPENESPSPSASSSSSSTTTTTFLQSVESGGSNAVPVVEEEDDVPAEERTKRILREKYGMKSLEEQQLDAKQREARKEKQRKLQEWKKKAEAGEEFDVMAMLPAPVIIGIDRFLKFGVGITGFLFVLAGVGITLEAWSKTTGQPLPDSVDSFIVNTVEPNFTPGLFVLLGFSVSLGIFAGLQLSSASAVYKEK